MSTGNRTCDSHEKSVRFVSVSDSYSSVQYMFGRLFYVSNLVFRATVNVMGAACVMCLLKGVGQHSNTVATVYSNREITG